MTSVLPSPLAQLSFPRTGKRGVPQQFPRRLYEMLESESKLLAAGNHHKVICWSDSGRAFRICDVAEFSNTVLPKYFRTKKFSSFQRNLNLYGFAKVRRGPETDMYAHPSFMRDAPGALLELRKISSASRRQSNTNLKVLIPTLTTTQHRAVSPSNSSGTQGSPRSPPKSIFRPLVPAVLPATIMARSNTIQSSGGASPTHDRGKLDLLALALEQC